MERFRGGAIGMDVDRGAIKAVQVSKAADGFILQHVGYHKLPEGAIVEGEVADSEMLAHEIKEFWDLHSFRGKSVVLGVAGRNVIVRFVDFPRLSAEDLDSAMSFQAEEHIPLPLEDAVLDHLVLGPSAENPEEDRVLLVAAHRAMISGYTAAARSGGLKPIGVDVKALALTRSALPDVLFDNEETVLLLDIGTELSNLVIVQNRMPTFTQFIPLGFRDFSQAVAEAADIEADEADKQALNPRANIGALPDEDRLNPPSEAETLALDEYKPENEVEGSSDEAEASNASAPDAESPGSESSGSRQEGVEYGAGDEAGGEGSDVRRVGEEEGEGGAEGSGAGDEAREAGSREAGSDVGGGAGREGRLFGGARESHGRREGEDGGEDFGGGEGEEGFGGGDEVREGDPDAVSGGGEVRADDGGRSGYGIGGEDVSGDSGDDGGSGEPVEGAAEPPESRREGVSGEGVSGEGAVDPGSQSEVGEEVPDGGEGSGESVAAGGDSGSRGEAGTEELSFDPALMYDVRRGLEDAAGRLAEEVQRSVEFHNSRPEAREVARILISGEGSLVWGLDGYIEDLLGVATGRARPAAKLTANRSNVSDEQLGAMEPVLAIALGLAMEDE